MRIISHRGYWKSPSEKNLEAAFRRSFDLGFGTETDLRDLDGQVVVAHDMPRSGNDPLTFEELLAIHAECGDALPLLLNIKADGLQKPVLEQIQRYAPAQYYLFDMSVPDLLASVRAGLQCLTRHSDVETPPHFCDETAGVWIDELIDEWIDERQLQAHAAKGREIFIVSPELHGRAHLPRWEQYREMALELQARCTLCTDFPEAAQAYFAN